MTDSKNIRAEALKILTKIEQSDGYFSETVDAYFTNRSLSSKEKRKIYALAAGVLRRREWLDYSLGQNFSGRYKKSQYHLRNLLRIGLYQIKMQNIPPFAVINEMVKLAKRQKGKIHGLINAVLRKVSEIDIHQMIQNDDSLSDIQKFALESLHPEWLVRRWLGRYSREKVRSLCEKNNASQTVSIRLNVFQKSRLDVLETLKQVGANFEISKTNPIFFRLKNAGNLPLREWITQGWCTVQDEAAGWVCHLLDPQPGEKIADICAAPGGKTTYIAQLMRDKGRVIGMDISVSRIEKIKIAKLQMKLASVEWRVGDAREITLPLQNRVLVDVPCTGTGVLGKRIDARWRKQEKDIARLIPLQKKILENAAKMVKINGVLVYSTCSLEPEENWEIVNIFLAKHNFRVEEAGSFIPLHLVDNYGAYVSFPSSSGFDGAFAVRMKKMG